jgi:hypothetical protein
MRATQQLSQRFNWEVLDHPVHRQEDEKVKNVVTAWLRSQAAKLCEFRIQELIPRLNKCLDKGGDYVEK